MIIGKRPSDTPLDLTKEERTSAFAEPDLRSDPESQVCRGGGFLVIATIILIAILLGFGWLANRGRP